MSILNLVRRPRIAPAWASVREVNRMLQGCAPTNGLVVIERINRPVGLVMRYDLDRKLDSSQGHAFYDNRPVSMVMNRSPLRVSESDSPETAAVSALDRPDEQIYDDIIVLDADEFLVGVVSVRSLLDTLAKLECGRDSKGLPDGGTARHLRILYGYLRHSRQHLSGHTDLGSLTTTIAEQVNRLAHATDQLGIAEPGEPASECDGGASNGFLTVGSFSSNDAIAE